MGCCVPLQRSGQLPRGFELALMDAEPGRSSPAQPPLQPEVIPIAAPSTVRGAVIKLKRASSRGGASPAGSPAKANPLQQSPPPQQPPSVVAAQPSYPRQVQLAASPAARTPAVSDGSISSSSSGTESEEEEEQPKPKRSVTKAAPRWAGALCSGLTTSIAL